MALLIVLVNWHHHHFFKWHTSNNWEKENGRTWSWNGVSYWCFKHPRHVHHMNGSGCQRKWVPHVQYAGLNKLFNWILHISSLPSTHTHILSWLDCSGQDSSSSVTSNANMYPLQYPSVLQLFSLLLLLNTQTPNSFSYTNKADYEFLDGWVPKSVEPE